MSRKCKPGCTCARHSISPEARRKVADALRGRPKSAEHRAKLAAANRKSPLSDAEFWAKADRTEGCWEWLGTRWANGYGRIGDKKAHRIAWERANGRPIPTGMLVCHRCDNPPCVNPAHLYLGTHRDNVRDRMERERGQRGTDVNTAKLTEEQVHEIRARCDRGEVHRTVAADFGISQVMVSLIARRKSWAWLPNRTQPPSGAEQQRQRDAKAAAGRKRAWTPERRAKQSVVTSERNKGNAYSRGRKLSAEHRAKISAARRKKS